MNIINFNADNLIIMWNPRFAGGKFIMNCLSLSRHCVPVDIETCMHLLDNPSDYKYRLDKIMSTLPAKSDISNWYQYEFNSEQFYDDMHPVLFDSEFSVFLRMQEGDIRKDGIDWRIAKLIENDIDFFAESRYNIRNINQYLSLWPRAKIVKLINFEKFQKLSSLRKIKQRSDTEAYSNGNECSERYNLLKGASWPSWELFEINHYNIDKVAKHVTISNDTINDIKTYYPWHSINAPIFNIDVDGTYFNKDKFFAQIKKLYNWLEYDDFNETLLSQYYDAYIELHIE